MQKFIYTGLAVLLFSCTNTKDESVQAVSSGFSIEGKKVTEYTTADSTNLRLALRGELEFKQKGQPFENEISVFVDPTKTYQEFSSGIFFLPGSADHGGCVRLFAFFEKLDRQWRSQKRI